MAEPTGVTTGTNDDYASLMPPLGNDADIQKAIQYYHYGNPDNAGLDPTSFPAGKDGGMARRLKDINDAIDAVSTGGIFTTVVTTKGDLIAGTGASAVTRLAAGTNGFVLKSNSATGTGLEWYNIDTSHLPLVGGTLTGNLTVTKASPALILNATSGNPVAQLRAPSATSGYVQFLTGTSTRWVFQKDSGIESGSDAGSNFAISRYSDSAVLLGNALTISRATGLTTLSSLSVSGTTSLTGNVTASSTVAAATAPSEGAHLTNKTYVDAQIATRLATAGGTLTGALTGTDITTSGNVVVGGTLLVSGVSTFNGRIVTVASSGAGGAGLRIPQGVAPTSPTNGDVWLETGRLYVRSNGITYPLASNSEKLNAFAATTSAELAAVISNETGSGSLVFNTSPAFAGNPTAPTQDWANASTRLATTAHVWEKNNARMYIGSDVVQGGLDPGAPGTPWWAGRATHIVVLINEDSRFTEWSQYEDHAALNAAGIHPVVAASCGASLGNLIIGDTMDTRLVWFGSWVLGVSHNARSGDTAGGGSRVNFSVAW